MTANQGKFVIAVAKSLKRFQASDAYLTAYLHASSFAGLAGLYAAAMRGQTINWPNAVVLAAHEGINAPELKTVVVLWLEETGQIIVTRHGEEIQAIKSVVLNYENILTSTCTLFEKRDPSDVDRACLHLIQMASDLPTTESEAMNTIAQQFNEQTASLAITLSKSSWLTSCNILVHLPKSLNEWSSPMLKSKRSRILESDFRNRFRPLRPWRRTGKVRS